MPPAAVIVHRHLRPAARRAACAALFALGACLPAGLPAQAVERAPAAPADTAAPHGISPGTAFLRAVLVPGWGHASIGAYTRGGFYFLAEGATAYGLIRTRQRLREARERVAFRERTLTTELLARGVTDPDSVAAALEDDARLEDLRALEEARGKQQEDLVALGVFLMFISGADAYVSAHLSGFPAPLAVEAAPAGNGRMELSLSVGVP